MELIGGKNSSFTNHFKAEVAIDIYQKAIHVISVEKEIISKFQFYTVRIKDMSLKSSITLVNKHLKKVGLHVL